MKLIKYFCVFVISIIVLVFAGFTVWKASCKSFLDDTIVNGEYFIEPGAGYNQVYDMVFSGLDTPAGLSFYLANVCGLSFHYGYYNADNSAVGQLIENIATGKQTATKVTIPEGYNMYDIAETLADLGVASKDAMLKVFKDRAFVEEMTGTPYESLEGFLSPTTYFLPKNSDAKFVAAAMVKEFYKSLPDNFEVEAKSEGLSFYDALILASIVQKETYSEAESPNVAAVFLNRIKAKMRIQADPTIIYGIYEKYNGDISKADIQDKTNRFNTYTNNGLPPTPISNPSAIALGAVINPADVDYYYFVASKDGEHIFAKNYADHQRNVRIHQLGRAQ